MTTNEQPIKQVLSEMIATYRMKAKVSETKINQLWAELMAPPIVKQTRSIRLRKKTLHIKVDSAPLRQELSMGRAKLIELINEHLGEAYLEDIKVE